MNSDQAVNAGYDLANRSKVGRWGIGAFCFAPIVLLVAHLRSPQLPVDVATGLDIDVRPFYERAYVDSLKKRQVKAAWIGAIIAFVVWSILLFSMMFMGLMFGISEM